MNEPRHTSLPIAAGPLVGEIALPGDKSISHRAVLLGALCRDGLRIGRLGSGVDVASSVACVRSLGHPIARNETDGVVIVGPLPPPDARPVIDSGVALDCGNSGTTMRLLTGWLAGRHPIAATLTGDASLTGRPMRRVTDPIGRFGPTISLSASGTAPLRIQTTGAPIGGLSFDLVLPSAQVKSAILLAGLRANGPTTITGRIQSRDHTERMIAELAGPGPDSPIYATDAMIRLTPLSDGGLAGLPSGATYMVPGDPSAAAFWLVAGAIVPGSDIVLRDVCANPTRTGARDLLREMGADIATEEAGEQHREPVETWRVRGGSELRAIDCPADRVPSMIDEVPVLAVAAAQASGRSRFRGLTELRVKESDRLAATLAGLRCMGVRAGIDKDDLWVEGRSGAPFQPTAAAKGVPVATEGDHRIAMAFAIAGLHATEPIALDDASCVRISDPAFLAERDRVAAAG